DLLTNADFRAQLDKTLAVAKEVNQAMGTQRFPGILQNDWEQIRTNLNSLARVYKTEALAILETPGSGGGRGGRGGRAQAATVATAAPPPGSITGYIVDQMCSTRGKGMWINAQCVARCVREGDSLVLVTEEGK